MIKDSVLVEVYLPCALRSYEVRLPRGLNVYATSMLTGQALASLTDGLYQPGRRSFLCWRETGIRLPSKATLAEAGVISGSRLMLV
ncbi:MAG: methyltransferase [Clostridia bacterium]|nr:methyltransferase [Clostridia bacterium]